MAHILVPGDLTFDLTAPFTQQGIYNSIRAAYPTSPDYTVVSIAIPLVYVNCLDIGIIDPVGFLKDATLKIYNYFMKYYIQPLWNALYSLYDALKSFGLGILDLTIGILDLTFPDLFDPNLIEKIKVKILDWYYNAKDKLIELLELLGIKWPIMITVNSPQFDIEYIINAIMNSLWAFVIRLIKKIWGFIATGLRLWEIATQQGAIIWSQLWNELIDSIIGSAIINLFTSVPTIEDIYNALVEFAKNVYNKSVVSIQEIIAVIKDFTFFGIKPFEWDVPWNINTNFPEVDLMRMINSMLMWFKNWMFNLVNQFVNAIASILQAFGISLAGLAVITIPITFCAIKNETA